MAKHPARPTAFGVLMQEQLLPLVARRHVVSHMLRDVQRAVVAWDSALQRATQAGEDGDPVWLRLGRDYFVRRLKVLTRLLNPDSPQSLRNTAFIRLLGGLWHKGPRTLSLRRRYRQFPVLWYGYSCHHRE